MPKIEPFEKYALQYEDWFKRHALAYESEMEAIRSALPKSSNGLEVGVGSGRFAQPLGIRLGVEPSPRMRIIAQQRGIEVMDGVAESLSFGDGMFDFVLMVAAICYFDDVEKAFKEARRVLKDNGSLVIGFIERDSPIGQAMRKEPSEFYSIAKFHSVIEVEAKLHNVGFNWIYYSQTLFKGLDEITEIEPVKEGFGEGSFVVVKAVK